MSDAPHGNPSQGRLQAEAAIGSDTIIPTRPSKQSIARGRTGASEPHLMDGGPGRLR